MQILVTGSKGFIGYKLLLFLRDKGYKVYEFDLEDKLPAHKVDLIFHLAAYADAYKSISSPDVLINNINIMYEVLEWARVTGTRKMIYASSREIYEPINPYGASKLVGEIISIPYAKTFGMGVVCARLSNIYGPGNLANRFIDQCIVKARSNDPIEIYGGHKKIMNFLHVTDCVLQLYSLIEKIRLNQINYYDINYPVSIKCYDLAKKVVDMMGSNSKVICKSFRKGEVREFIPKGYFQEPTISLDQGIRQTIGL